MDFKRIFLLSTGILGLVFSMQIFAHAMLESTSPADKAVLSPSPPSINFNFGHKTKLVKVNLISTDQEKSLPVDISLPNAKTFSISLPALKPGSYQVNWSSLSGDGHAVTGTFSFTISGH
jgi:methionine-rich copper-binding protein CopC